MASLEDSDGGSFDGRAGLDPYLDPAVAVPTLAVTASELLLFVGRADLALWGHLLTILFCAFAALELDDAVALQVFVLVPVFRLVNLGMPTFVELTIYWYPLVYAPVLPAAYVAFRNPAVPKLRFHARNAALLMPPGIALAAVLGEIEYRIITPEALIPEWSLFYLLVIAAVMICFVGFVEELVFRGLLQPTLQERLGTWAGVLLASFLFGVMHSAYGSVAEIAFAAGIGLVLGLLYDATGSLGLVTVVHGVLNVFLFAVVPIQGSLFG